MSFIHLFRRDARCGNKFSQRLAYGWALPMSMLRKVPYEIVAAVAAEEEEERANYSSSTDDEAEAVLEDSICGEEEQSTRVLRSSCR